MALGDLIQNLNPMGFARGYRFGLETEQQRHTTDTAGAQSQIAQQKAKEFTGEQEIMTRQLEDLVRQSTARLSGMQKDLDIEVFGEKRPAIKQALGTQIETLQPRAETALIEARGGRERAPREQQLRGARLDADIAAQPREFEQRMSSLTSNILQNQNYVTNEQRLQAIRDTMASASEVMVAARTKAGGDDWVAFDIALQDAPDDNTRAAIMDARRTYALGQLKASPGDLQAIQKYLPAFTGRNLKLAPVIDPATKQPIPGQVQFFEEQTVYETRPGGGRFPIETRQSVVSPPLSTSPDPNVPNSLTRWVKELTGERTDRVPAQKPAGPPSPADAAAARTGAATTAAASVPSASGAAAPQQPSAVAAAPSAPPVPATPLDEAMARVQKALEAQQPAPAGITPEDVVPSGAFRAARNEAQDFMRALRQVKESGAKITPEQERLMIQRAAQVAAPFEAGTRQLEAQLRGAAERTQRRAELRALAGLEEVLR